MSGYTAPASPYPPSLFEAKRYYYGLPSNPVLVARSSANVWVEPRGPEAFLTPKEIMPLGLHPIQAIWEATIGPAMITYLDSKGVKWTSLDPIRMGKHMEDIEACEPFPPAIIWIGVVPGSLSAEDGIGIATDCMNILTTHDINDIHVEIRESEVIRSAKLYKPTGKFKPVVLVQEPFSTALGLPICAQATPSIEGTGGFFISDPRHHGKLYLVTARHVVFHPDGDSNELFQHCNETQPRRNVLLFGDAAIEKRTMDIELKIQSQGFLLDYLERRLDAAVQMDGMDEEEAKEEREHVQPKVGEVKETIKDLQRLLTDVSRDWKDRENRVLGYVVLSPPISHNVGEEGFTEDWAVIEIDPSKVDSTNFVGNVIDLGSTIPRHMFQSWMSPCPTAPSSFEYPKDRLLKFHGTVSDDEMWKKPGLSTSEQMVIKRGCATNLTIGCLNTIRSFTRVYPKGHQQPPSQVSKEVAVLPRHAETSVSICPGAFNGAHAFSSPGDSGSAVVDGKGRLVGLLTGGAGDNEESDCSYITSINFLVKRMFEYGLEANLTPSLDD